MTSEADTQERLEKKLWEEIERSGFVMLGLQGVDESFTRPMTAQVDHGQIYFFAARSEDLVKGLARTNRAIATFASKGHDLFASINGILTIDNDRAVIDRLWNPIIASWYKDGKDDPDLALVRFDAEKAEIWEATPGATLKAAALKMLFDIDPGKEHQQDHQAKVQL